MPFKRWTLPRPDLRIKIPGIKQKGGLSKTVLQYLAMDIRFHNHGSHTHVYADGSTYALSSGVVFLFPADGTWWILRFDHKTSSAEAQLVAIYKAVEYISAQYAQAWIIKKDPRASLESLGSINKGCIHQKVV